MTFPLAGLLRVRGAQERLAAERLSAARSDRIRAEDAERSAVSSLADVSAEIGDGATLMAMAAARAAGRSALSDLQALTALRRDEEAAAHETHIEARRELKGLERMEDAHRREEARAETRAEQSALDEIAVVRSNRREGSAA
ncbi:flagellar FliJ family protein [Streptomyces sp. AC495_CC817]|uniref:flagellar FliJ family protein n=1 Tax=Streptomyces sp. AC495_CC817 TaxID=2823900 RepID=UPI001C26847E|nr:flagellar FliJ family protein [Streptomyces sp. AC495_CC817]